ncbi:hypothetical protein [Bryobacter aggregatus]|uniref:hypothetical protein n=1 Tax=Bryobacter aggregatus TaxID=360054 RepID=UPI0004E244F8|nr:hypothetical protein [Bryobacter aggregatus]
MGSQEGCTQLGVTSTGCKRARNNFGKIVLGLALLPVFWAQPVFGQAQLRLSDTALGPISIATGSNGTAQTIEAYNAGTGNLALSFSSNATWLSASAGASRACQIAVQQSSCTPITISLATASLAKGSYTGAITVKDPSAVDAPQTVTVTVQVGGGVPDTVFLYVAPNGTSDSYPFSTNSVLNTAVATQSGGNWLTVAYEGAGSFRFVQPYRIVGTRQAGQGEGTYNGTVQVSGSSFAGDNKTVQTRLVVTSQPIAFAGPETLSAKVVQNSAATTLNVGVGNRGVGALTVGAITTTMTNGTGWLSATAATGFTGAAVTLTPGSLPAGTYRGTVNIATNSINAPSLAVPVTMEVVTAAVPTISYNGVLNNATFQVGDTLGVGAIAAVFGEFLTDGLYYNTSSTLPTTLGGARVLVNGVAAPLYFASPGQINFQVPLETQGGSATIQVEHNGVVGNRVSVTVVAQAGRILVWPGLKYGIIVSNDGSLPMPSNVVLGTYVSKPAKPGDVLVVYAIGFGQTTPPVATGASAPLSPLAQLSNVVVRFGVPDLFNSSIPVGAQFAGLTPGFVGLYQINVQVPVGVPTSSDYDLTIEYNGQFSNRVKIATQQQ